MAVFEYKALGPDGKPLKGEISSETLKAAKSALKARNVFLQEIRLKESLSKPYAFLTSKKIKNRDITVFTRLLATLIKAGIPLVEALDSISQQTSDKSLAQLTADIRDQVNEGKAFYLALKKHSSVFDVTYVSLCQAGEAGGSLDETLSRLADLREKQEKTLRKISGALIYPGILFFSCIAIMVFLFTNVVPQITDLLEDESQIPWITQVTMGFSAFLSGYWISLLVFSFIAVSLFFKWKRTPKGKLAWDYFVLKLPVIGRLLRTSDISLFSKTLAALMSGGVPVLRAMDIVRDVVRNDHIKLALQTAKRHIKEGESIASPLERSGQFPPVVIQMIRVGEKSGRLEDMLDQVSEAHDRQAESEIEALTAVLNPIMIIFMAGMVAFVVFSVLLPMMSSFEGLEG